MHPQGYMLHVSQASFTLNSKIYRHFQEVRQVHSDIGADCFFSPLNCKVYVKYCFTGNLLQQFLLKQHLCMFYVFKGEIERERNMEINEILFVVCSTEENLLVHTRIESSSKQLLLADMVYIHMCFYTKYGSSTQPLSYFS